jgi:hypothetical protein
VDYDAARVRRLNVEQSTYARRTLHLVGVGRAGSSAPPAVGLAAAGRAIAFTGLSPPHVARSAPQPPVPQPPRPVRPARQNDPQTPRRILAAIRLGINQGRTEALNNKVRLITRRAYGFHSAKAALALVMLTCGPITLHLPHELYSP